MRAALVVAALAAVAGPAAAERWEISSSDGARGEYNTNWRLVAPPYENVFITALFATVEASRRSEASTIALAGTVSPFIVIGETGASRVDARLSASATRQFDRDELTASALYLRDSTLLTEFRQTGVALTQAERELVTLAPAWVHRFSERWKGRLGYAYSSTRYPDDAPGLVDFDYHVASGTLTYAWSERLDAFMKAGYSRYTTRPEANQTVSTELGAGVSGRFTERLTGLVSASAYRADIRSVRAFLLCPAPAELCRLGLVAPIPVQSGLSRSDTGYVFDGSLEWRLTERSVLAASAGRSLQPSGSGAVYAVERAAFSASHQFSPVLAGSAGVSVSDSRLAGATTAATSEQRVYSAAATLTWRLDRAWQLEGGVRHTRVDYPAPSADVTGTAVFVGVVYAFNPIGVSR